MNRYANIFSLVFVTASLSAFPQEAGSDYSEELQAIRSEIGQLSKDLDQQVARRDKGRDKLIEIEKKVAALERELESTRVERARQQALMADIEGEMSLETVRQADHRESLAALVHATYIMGERSYLKMLLNQQNPYSLGRTINYYRYISSARSNELGEIREQLAILAKLREDKKAEGLKLKEIETRHREQIVDLQGARDERELALAALQKKIDTTDAHLARLKEDQDRLARLAGDLAKYSRRLRNGNVEPGGFDRQRGRLQLPVAGKLRQEFGNLISGSGLPSNGIFIDTSNVVSVHSIFRGQVIFADWLRGFGLLVIVDHGEGYMSLYGHNKILYKQVGDMVETGETIAQSGTTGGLTSPGVYFEIRQEGKPRNPMLWCRL
jgi:septal ring factor EnvC (AmiA/AmiB activator)